MAAATFLLHMCSQSVAMARLGRLIVDLGELHPYTDYDMLWSYMSDYEVPSADQSVILESYREWSADCDRSNRKVAPRTRKAKTVRRAPTAWDRIAADEGGL